MTFDHLTPDGIAISTKTLDTTAKKYSKRPASITSTLNGYVRAMVEFTEDRKDSFNLTAAAIQGREMQLGIPATTTPEQMAAIAKSVHYAESKGIESQSQGWNHD